MRKRVIKILKPLDGRAVENAVGPGTPDVNYIGGWVELKKIRYWPRRGGPVRVPHFTQQQRVWLERRWHRGGAVYMLIQIERDWLLLNGDVAAEHLGYADEGELIRLAHRYWKDGLDERDLRETLAAGRQ